MARYSMHESDERGSWPRRVWFSYVAFLNRRWLRSGLAVVALVGLLTLIINQFVNGSSFNEEFADVYQGMMVVVAVFGSWALYPFLRLRTSDDQRIWRLDEEAQSRLKHFLKARRSYRKVKSKNESSLRSKQSQLAALSDPRGQKIISSGGVTVYERWLETPVASTSIIGYQAGEVAGRPGEVLIFGPIPENNALGRFGEDAKKVANAINLHAKTAERNEPYRRERLAHLPSEIAALQNDARVPAAEAALDSAKSDLPPGVFESLVRRETRRKRVRNIVVGLVIVSFISGNFQLPGRGSGNPKVASATTIPVVGTTSIAPSDTSTTPTIDDTVGLPAGSIKEAEFQCGTKLVQILETYRIDDLNPMNIGKTWFNNSDYKLRVGKTPVEISQPLIRRCADAAEKRLAVIESAVKMSCNWPRTELATEYGLPKSSSSKIVAKTVAKDFEPALQPLAAALCAQYIR